MHVELDFPLCHSWPPPAAATNRPSCRGRHKVPLYAVPADNSDPQRTGGIRSTKWLSMRMCCLAGQHGSENQAPCQGIRMPETALGILLKRMRENRKLSLRELAQLTEVDHAYIYRLETGAKESPSDEVLTKLARALKPGRREADILHYVASHPTTDPRWVEFCIRDSTVTYNEFASVAGAVYRGNARLDYAKRLELIRRIMEEEGFHG